ncbi:MAG: sodium:proton antiporter [Verrucomicrobia bacterium]|jgi:multisubunit Na+/H+ antiporter MnhF subunit|nr:sodium:proton antiporter [Verrucomicrobiota bacterium]
MITLALQLCFGVLTAAVLLGLARLVKGPTVLDRILAFDLIATSIVGMIALLSVKWRTAMYLELILVFSLLGFAGTVAFVFHLHRTVPDPRGPAPAPPSPTATPAPPP